MMLKAAVNRALQSGFLKNLSYVSSSKLLTSVLSILVKIYVVRVLTKEEFGTITVLLSLYVYFSFVADMSVYQVVQKDIVSAKDKYWNGYNLFANSKIYTISLAVILFFGVSFILGYREYYAYITILALSMILDSVYRMPEILLLSFDKYKLYSKLVVSTNLFFTLLQGLLVFLFKSIFAYFIAMLINLIVSAAVYYYFTGKEFPDIYKFRPLKKERVIDLLKKAFPLSAGSFLYLIYYRVDIFFIEKYLGISAAGEYGLSFSILDQFIYLIFAQFLIVLYPRLIQFHNEDKLKLKRTLDYINLGFIGMFIAFTILSAFLAEHVIVFVFGAAYANSAALLTYLLPNLGLTCIYLVYSRIMIIASKEKIYLAVMGAGFIIKIILSYILIGRYGMPGIIGATLAAFIMVDCFFYYIIKKTYKAKIV